MKILKQLYFLLLVPFVMILFSCQGQTGKATTENKKEDSNSKADMKPPVQRSVGKGTLSFKMNGQLYSTDPQRTKCWTTSNVPLAMLMARGDGLSVSWQMGYQEANRSYKLDGDAKGTINFTIGDKTYWTRRSDNYLNITITNIKDKYTLRLLSGTFEGVLEDKDGNKVQITEGSFVTDDI